jgi:penicillin-insensitive murein DD-endopeptidase
VRARRIFLVLGLTVCCGAVGAQERLSTSVPAKLLFSAVARPAPLAARSIGFYSRGCLAGAVALPITGPSWQVMRLSRNRNWGHPRLVRYLERLAKDAGSFGWSGLLVGDLSQPRGGPMPTGHTSHQIGLDADIWLTPMPNRLLTRQEREDMMAVSMLRDPLNVDLSRWTALHTRLIKAAASYPEVERIFVHPAIKQVLCNQAGRDRAWLSKVRPWWGHYYHFHVRIACSPGDGSCRAQQPVHGDDGCDGELDDWFTRLRQAEMQPSPSKPSSSDLKLDDLPTDCRALLAFGGSPLVSSRALSDKPAGPPPPHFRFWSGFQTPSSRDREGM